MGFISKGSLGLGMLPSHGGSKPKACCLGLAATWGAQRADQLVLSPLLQPCMWGRKQDLGRGSQTQDLSPCCPGALDLGSTMPGQKPGDRCLASSTSSQGLLPSI